jgi:cytochrome c5
LLVLGINQAIADNGKKTFDKVCSSCHTGGFKGWLSGAPEIGNKEKWAKFIKRDSIDTMKKIVLKGTDDHKVKGGCKKCADSDILSAVEYMVAKSK